MRCSEAELKDTEASNVISFRLQEQMKTQTNSHVDYLVVQIKTA